MLKKVKRNLIPISINQHLNFIQLVDNKSTNLVDNAIFSVESLEKPQEFSFESGKSTSLKFLDGSKSINDLIAGFNLAGNHFYIPEASVASHMLLIGKDTTPAKNWLFYQQMLMGGGILNNASSVDDFINFKKLSLITARIEHLSDVNSRFVANMFDCIPQKLLINSFSPGNEIEDERKVVLNFTDEVYRRQLLDWSERENYRPNFMMSCQYTNIPTLFEQARSAGVCLLVNIDGFEKYREEPKDVVDMLISGTAVKFFVGPQRRKDLDFMHAKGVLKDETHIEEICTLKPHEGYLLVRGHGEKIVIPKPNFI